MYQGNKTYKKVNDFKYTRPIRKATILGFVISFFIFQVMGSLWPEIFNPAHPKVAEGGSNTVTWTTDADFNAGTTKSGVKVQSDSVTLNDPDIIPEVKASGNDLYAVRFLDTNNGYAVGMSGLLLKTIDGGVNWSTKNPGTSNNLNEIYIVDANISYVVGDGGVIRKTTDSGTTWATQTSGTTNNLNGVYFTDANTGYVVGDSGTIKKTTDGGTNWVAQTSGTTYAFEDIFFVGGSTGYAAGSNGSIYKTLDGGTNWVIQATAAGTSYNSIYFTDANTGYAPGNIVLKKTTDGGTNWTTNYSLSGNTWYGVHFADANTGYVSGSSGKVRKTINSGTSWTDQTTGFGAGNVYDIYFTDANNGYAVGASGKIIKTTNGGANWTLKTLSVTGNNLNSTYFTDSNTGYAVGNSGTILKTTNGSASWSALTSGTSSVLNGVYFTDNNTGYAVGASGLIRKTTDGGANWVAQTSGTTYALYGIHFTDASTGYTTGDNGTILKTTDGGANWVAQTSGTTGYFRDVYFTDANTGFLAGRYGIYKTTNGGTNWSSVSGSDIYLNSMYFTDANTGYAVGNSGTIIKTTNGGANWAAQTSGTTNQLNSTHFTSASTGYIVGVNGTILETNDGGTNWSLTSVGTSLSSVYFTDANTGYAVGSTGFILKFYPQYATSGDISGLKVDAGEGAKANWSSITNSSTLLSNTSVSFQTRGSDDNSTWSGWQSLSGETIQTAEYRYLEVKATLSTSDGLHTPSLNDLTVTYDNLEAPVNSNITLTKTDGTALKTSAGDDLAGGVAGGWTNATTVRLTATGLTCGQGTPENPTCGSSSTNRRPEVEIKEMGTVFDGAVTYEAVSGNSYVDVALPGIPVTGQEYHIRARSIDDEGKASGWTQYASDTAAITYDNTPAGVFNISTPADNNWGTARPTFTWASTSDANSGINKYQLYIDGALDTDNISAVATSVQATNSLIDGSHTWYVKAVDNAGNARQSTSTFTVNIDTSAPTSFNLSTPANNSWTNNTGPTLTWTASSDPHSVLAKYQLYINGSLNRDNISSVATSTTPTGSQTGTYSWYIKAINNAGGETNSATYTINYDNAATFPSPFVASSNDAEKVVVSWSDQNTGAPTDTFTVHRVKKSEYDSNSWTKDSDWSTGTDYGVFTIAGGVGVLNDSSLGAVQGQPIISQSVNYVYKIKSTDTAGNASGWSSVVIGRTTDTADPQDPSTVTAVACDGTAPNCSNILNKGYEIKLAWAASNDFGSGVTGYKVYRNTANSTDPSTFALVGYLDVPTPGAPVSTVYYDNDANNDKHDFTDTINEQQVSIKAAATGRLNDYVNYYYRIVAVDAVGNETNIITTEGLGLPNYTNYATARTPDVTSPSTPQNVVVTPMGLDSSGGAQRVDVTWSTSTDITSRNAGASGSGIAGYKVMQCQGDGTFCTDDGNYSQIGTTSSTNYTKEGLGEFTWYYYKIIAVDKASSATITDTSNNSSARSSSASVKTASNTVPTVPLSVNVTTKTGDPNTDSDVGHQNTVTFNGSYAKNCAGGERCVTGYEIYRSTDNFASSSLKIADVSIGAVGDERSVTYTYIDNNSTNDATAPSISRSSGGTPALSKAQTAHLVDAATYYYKVKSKDNTPTVPDGGPFTSGMSSVAVGTLHAGWDTTPDATDPDVPQSVAVKNIHPNDSMVRNIITWTMIPDSTRNGTSDFSKYQIYRYEVLLGSGTATLIAEKTDRGDNYHVDGITNGQKDKDYAYYVVAVDNAGTDFKYANGQIINPTSNTSSHIATVSINPGAVNPSVSGTTVASTGVSSATINWSTNQETDSLVEYKVKDSNDVIAAGKDRTQPTTSHSVSLGNLSKGVAYQYRIVSRNSLGNIDESAANTWKEFSTQDFYISDNTVLTTTSTATISWNTNIDSDSYVEYKPEGSSEKYEVAGDAVPTKNHEVTLKGLVPNSHYTYNLRSVTSDKYIVTKNLDTFKTRDNDLDKFRITPGETNVSEQNITATTTQITWTTTVATTSWVEYGTEVGVYSMSAGDNDLNTLHAVKLTNLRPGTKYFYRVRGKDENGVELFSPESSFTAILMPEISNLKVRDFSPYTATITFDTNVETVVSLNYGKDTSYGSSVTVAKAEKNHVITLKELDDNATYHFQASATDQFKNNIKSSDMIFSTPLDTQGPEVSELKVDVLPVSDASETASVIISWTTDKPATTQVEYDDKGGGEKYENHTIENATLNTSHTVLIKDLNTSANYRFRIISKDKRNNLTKTKASNFITPTKEKSLLQIIIKSFEDTFSWTKNVPQFFGKIGNRLMGQ
ncbi:MAG: YCF48-related protein [bacterium]|nr:YCF48-related protein [bacterium]